MPPNERLPPDSATILERSRGVFFAQWDELLRLRRAVMKTSDPDDIHDLRVTSRRFRAAFELYYPFAPKGPRTVLGKTARELTRTLGGLRNIDEAQIFFRSRVKSDASCNKLCDSLSELRSRELKRIGKELRAFNHRILDRMVREMVAEMSGNCVADGNRFSLLAYFSEASIRKYLPIHEFLAVSTALEHREERHSLRIAIKKWRYLLEIVALVLDRDYSGILDHLKEYQSILGRMNDIVVFEVMICSLEMPPEERQYVETTLQTEDALLLERFRELAEQKPLHYTFLV